MLCCDIQCPTRCSKFQELGRGKKKTIYFNQMSMCFNLNTSHRHLIKLYFLLCYSSGNFEHYGWCHKPWQNIDFIVTTIRQVCVMIYQQGNKEKWEQEHLQTKNELHIFYLLVQVEKNLKSQNKIGTCRDCVDGNVIRNVLFCFCFG